MLIKRKWVHKYLTDENESGTRTITETDILVCELLESCMFCMFYLFGPDDKTIASVI